MTKKSHQNFGRENGNFFREKRHSEILVREKFSVPPNSAPGLRHWFRLKSFHGLAFYVMQMVERLLILLSPVSTICARFLPLASLSHFMLLLPSQQWNFAQFIARMGV